MMLSFVFVSLSIFAAAVQAGKRGLAWPWYNAPLNPGEFNKGGKVVAIYDWETYEPPSSNGNGGLNFIGTQRCLDCGSSPITALASRAHDQNWTTVFTLNEPDLNGISPGQAASWYIQHINPLPIKKALPAVTSGTGANQGLNWISQMITACGGQCQFNYINLHWYGASFEQFKSYIESAHSKFPTYSIVITEFALQDPPGGQADQVQFFKQAFRFLDEASYIKLYFPFLASSPSLSREHNFSGGFVDTSSCLYNDDGTPSAVGEVMFQ